MEDFLNIAAANQERAREVIRESGVVAAWESMGAKVNLVGSLKSGLLMKNRDVDFHIYTPELNLEASFAAMARLAENPGIKRMQYANLIDTEEECVEWHAWYEDRDRQLWQIDMIHLRKGSAFDGWAERFTEKVISRLTPETRKTILRLKYETPEQEKVVGAEYYVAVLRDGVHDYAGFSRWRKEHPADGLVEWDDE